ncbi:hypothetical protein V5P93_007278 [Actinokineospora auranticolor]|uniref:Uncharacterized protein n=1 Tax=Actinokineospora auranticolor TaxID=155976 RepID=A0A2S6GRY8_9PSEU|nr:hypothetical protein [Actinokineospora auranticolor]PPK67933.1 hypothetical protein CLV40_106164 [Actinokineospora auranticolor]
MPDDLGMTSNLDVAVTEDQRARAARVVAATAADAGECAELLAMLGLTPEVGLRKQHSRAA